MPNRTTADWKSEPKTWAAIVIALLLWASAFAGIRAGLESYGPGQVALLRFGTASLVLGLFAAATRMRMPDVRDIPQIVLAGFLGISVYHVALNYGEQTVMAAAAALIISSSPVFTALLSTRFLGERLTPIGWTGVLASFAGVALIAAGEGGGLNFNTDALLILVAAVATSLYFIVSKPSLKRYSGLEFTSYAIWAGTVPMLAFLPGLIEQMPVAQPSATWAVVFMGIFPGALAYVLWSHALSRMPASSLSAFLNFQPVNAAVIAWLWLGEVPSLLTVIGGSIAVAGVALVQARGHAPAPVPPDAETLVSAGAPDQPRWRIAEVDGSDPELLGAVRTLFTDYHQWLGNAVCSSHLAEEIADLPGPYAPPHGRLLVALAECPDAAPSQAAPSEVAIACVALRRHHNDACEIKRLYVAPGSRGLGVGRALLERAIEDARTIGYREVLMTTLPDMMSDALAMYERTGFVPTDPFVDYSQVEEHQTIAYLSMPLV